MRLANFLGREPLSALAASGTSESALDALQRLPRWLPLWHLWRCSALCLQSQDAAAHLKIDLWRGGTLLYLILLLRQEFKGIACATFTSHTSGILRHKDRQILADALTDTASPAHAPAPSAAAATAILKSDWPQAALTCTISAGRNQQSVESSPQT